MAISHDYYSEYAYWLICHTCDHISVPLVSYTQRNVMKNHSNSFFLEFLEGVGRVICFNLSWTLSLLRQKNYYLIGQLLSESKTRPFVFRICSKIKTILSTKNFIIPCHEISPIEHHQKSFDLAIFL